MENAQSGYFNNRFMEATSKGAGVDNYIGKQLKDDDLGMLAPLNLSRRQLNLLSPYISGRAIFVPTQMAVFMKNKFPEHTKQFSQLLLTRTTRFEVETDLSAEVGTVENGNEGQAVDYISKVTGGIIRECSLTIPAEIYDGFITKYQSAWITGCYSPADGVVHMYGDEGLSAASNMSMEGIYIVLDPSERIVVHAVYMTNMLPKNSPNTIYNATRGENAHQEVTLQYACRGIQGDANVMKVAQEYIDSLNSKRNHDSRLSGNTYGDIKIEKDNDII